MRCNQSYTHWFACLVLSWSSRSMCFHCLAQPRPRADLSMNVKVNQSCLSVTPCTIHSMEFPRPEYWSGWSFPSPGYLPNLGMKPRSSALQADSLPADPPGKPKNTGVGSLSLLQGLVLTQELKQGLLHCRWTLYQLRYQGGLIEHETNVK